MLDCSQRIKPKMLREVKTEALLVFIRTTLEKFFIDLQNNKISHILGDEEDSKIIEKNLKELFNHLQKYVVSSKYIQTLSQKAEFHRDMRLLLKQEEPLIIYYDSMVRQLERSLPQGSNWIPEQLVFCLLSEWILEEEKSIILYPFLKNFDYIHILSRYDNLLSNDKDKSKVIKEMYLLGGEIIKKLKATKYKTNTKRKSKFRKK